MRRLAKGVFALALLTHPSPGPTIEPCAKLNVQFDF
jgi:hypothetical protein